MIEESAHLRIDLLGSTLDIRPVGLVLGRGATLNAATTMAARASVEEAGGALAIESSDYGGSAEFRPSDLTPENLASDFFGPFRFIALVLDAFGALRGGLAIATSSDSPPGAGLGGSSAMGLALARALCRLKGERFDPGRAVRLVGGVEARVLDAGPTGDQDFHPAIHGGALALTYRPDGTEVEQLHSPALADALENTLTLVYSGTTRSSGSTNWAIYKRFFDGDADVRRRLREIADLSLEAVSDVRAGRLGGLPELVGKEGALRAGLHPDIVLPETAALHREIAADVPGVGLKPCGAGGGGCFLLAHRREDRDAVRRRVRASRMRLLDLAIAPPAAPAPAPPAPA